MQVARCAVVSFLTLLAARSVPAQIYGDGRHGALAPAADVTLDTTANGGVFQFTSISVPAGITVHLTGSNPAQFLCRGAITIDGTIEADAPGSSWPTLVNHSQSLVAGPGGHAGGSIPMMAGNGPGGGPPGECTYPALRGGSASHATPGTGTACQPTPPPTYGAALPFDLRGGSGGGPPGSSGNAGDWGPPASGGGGVIAILAEGPINVTGRVSARGGDITLGAPYFFNAPPGIGGNGSGGAILLRSLQCVRVSGTLDVSGGSLRIAQSLYSTAGHGWIRIDAYSACGAPNVAGATIVPAPYVASMPLLTELGPARIGQVYRMRCASPPGDLLGLYLSFGTSVLPVPPFGVVQLDPAFILFLGQYSVPTSGHDPLAAADIAIPNQPALVGLWAYTQMFNAFGAVTGQARLSNLLTTRIGS